MVSGTCPNSPATLCRPRNSSPRTMTPIPRPSETLTNTKSPADGIRSRRASPRAAPARRPGPSSRSAPAGQSPIAEQIVDIDVAPSERRRMQHAHRRVLDHPGDGHAHAFAGAHAAVFGEQRANARAERRCQQPRVANRRKSDDAAERLAQQVGGHQIGAARTHVHGDDRAPLRVDVEECGLSAANGAAAGALDDQAALQQVADEEADAAAPHAHRPREVGTRDRLIGANEIEHDLTIDLARRALGGDLEANGINLSH